MFRRNPLFVQVPVGEEPTFPAVAPAAGPLAGAILCQAEGVAGEAIVAARAVAIELAEKGGAQVAPDWIELLPVGDFALGDGRGPFRNAEPARVIAATLARGVDPVIDYDHATVYAPKGTQIPAAGWIKQLEVRGDKICARVEWTGRGAAAIAAREWRYISPVFIANETTGEVTRIWHAALTNDPAIAMKAVAAAHLKQTERDDAMSDTLRKKLAKLLGLAETATESQITAALEQAKPLSETETDRASDRAIAAATQTVLAPIAKALGLAETAKAEDIAAAVAAAIKNPDPAKFVPIAAFNELQTRVATLEGDAKSKDATAEVEAAIAAGKLTPALRDWGLDYAKRDPAGFKGYVAKAPTIVAGGRVVEGDPKGAADTLSADEKTVCAAMGLTEADFLATKKANAAARGA